MSGHRTEPARPVCVYYAEGFCRNGNRCRFSHAPPMSHSGGGHPHHPRQHHSSPAAPRRCHDSAGGHGHTDAPPQPHSDNSIRPPPFDFSQLHDLTRELGGGGMAGAAAGGERNGGGGGHPSPAADRRREHPSERPSGGRRERKERKEALPSGGVMVLTETEEGGVPCAVLVYCSYRKCWELPWGVNDGPPKHMTVVDTGCGELFEETAGMIKCDRALLEHAPRVELRNEVFGTVFQLWVPAGTVSPEQFAQNARGLYALHTSALQTFQWQDEKNGIALKDKKSEHRRTGVAPYLEMRELALVPLVNLSAVDPDAPSVCDVKGRRLELNRWMFKALIEVRGIPSSREDVAAIQRAVPEPEIITIRNPRFSTSRLTNRCTNGARGLRLVGGTTVYLKSATPYVGASHQAALEHQALLEELRREAQLQRWCCDPAAHIVNDLVLRGVSTVIFDWDGCAVAWPPGGSSLEHADIAAGGHPVSHGVTALLTEMHRRGGLVPCIVTETDRRVVEEVLVAGQPPHMTEWVEEMVVETRLLQRVTGTGEGLVDKAGNSLPHPADRTVRKNAAILLLLHRLYGRNADPSTTLLIDDDVDALRAFVDMGGHGLSVKYPREGLSLRDLIHRKLLYQWSGSEHCEQLRHERLQAARVDTRFGGDPSEWAGLLLDR
eukprot:m.465842 g.465842  ORF g.465842 m.465842 type:complete len:664 (+) comp24623_c0_seq1:203-2194(+)